MEHGEGPTTWLRFDAPRNPSASGNRKNRLMTDRHRPSSTHRANLTNTESYPTNNNPSANQPTNCPPVSMDGCVAKDLFPTRVLLHKQVEPSTIVKKPSSSLMDHASCQTATSDVNNDCFRDAGQATGGRGSPGLPLLTKSLGVGAGREQETPRHRK